MQILLSNSAGVPIYQQIMEQIQQAILTGELAEGETLPSLRVLARDLRVSVITTTRAYNELAAEGYVANVPGKGFYVLPTNGDLVREQVLRGIEALMSEAVTKAKLAGVSSDELHVILDQTIEEES